ncbi:MAG TPA: hypothetical protein VEZ72_12440 [Paenibacillus sp.]|nr:hypothetical protein [Paenibacillus sp.]
MVGGRHSDTGVGVTHDVKEDEESACVFEISVGDRYGSIPTAALDRLFERMNVGT